MKIKAVYKILLILIFSSLVSAQDNLPRLSPKSFVGQTIGYTNVQINYGSPGVKGREIWGSLVPFNKVWRTGANEATTIEFDNDILINGSMIPQGKYSLFSIPNEDSWTIILNKKDDQWGAYKYDINEDIIRFNVKPKTSRFTERLQFSFEYISPYKTQVVLEWAELKIAFEIDAEVKKIKEKK